MTRKKIALKYCGGCNPGFDRLEYFGEIKSIAGNLVEWVTPENDGFATILLIQGCNVACSEKDIDSAPYNRIISVKNKDHGPEEIVKILLSTEAKK